jgi:hypothetical protein
MCQGDFRPSFPQLHICTQLLGITESKHSPGDPFDVLVSFRQQLNMSLFIDIIIIIMSWSLWMARNDFVIKGQQPSLLSIKACFRKELALVNARAKSSLKQLMSSWLEAFV